MLSKFQQPPNSPTQVNQSKENYLKDSPIAQILGFGSNQKANLFPANNFYQNQSQNTLTPNKNSFNILDNLENNSHNSFFDNLNKSDLLNDVNCNNGNNNLTFSDTHDKKRMPPPLLLPTIRQPQLIDSPKTKDDEDDDYDFEFYPDDDSQVNTSPSPRCSFVPTKSGSTNNCSNYGNSSINVNVNVNNSRISKNNLLINNYNFSNSNFNNNSFNNNNNNSFNNNFSTNQNYSFHHSNSYNSNNIMNNNLFDDDNCNFDEKNPVSIGKQNFLDISSIRASQGCPSSAKVVSKSNIKKSGIRAISPTANRSFGMKTFIKNETENKNNGIPNSNSNKIEKDRILAEINRLNNQLNAIVNKCDMDIDNEKEKFKKIFEQAIKRHKKDLKMNYNFLAIPKVLNLSSPNSTATNNNNNSNNNSNINHQNSDYDFNINIENNYCFNNYKQTNNNSTFTTNSNNRNKANNSIKYNGDMGENDVNEVDSNFYEATGEIKRVIKVKVPKFILNNDPATRRIIESQTHELISIGREYSEIIENLKKENENVSKPIREKITKLTSDLAVLEGRKPTATMMFNLGQNILKGKGNHNAKKLVWMSQ